MFSFLLAVIYAAFISLGLPDSLLGSAWPVMRAQLGAPLSFAGLISMIIAGGTILSSLLSDRMTKRFGAGMVTFVSVAATALALFGFSVSGSLWMLCLWAVPYGLGAGAVDAALNNYVALHYPARHMSWLHCFWGVGATIGPVIMGACLSGRFSWQGGYRAVAVIQIALTAVLFVSLPKWKAARGNTDAVNAQSLGILRALRIRGVPYMLIAFLCYCAMETSAGLWASTYLAEARNVSAQTAARFASLFYLGITAGRFAGGFVADKLGDKRMIRVGLAGIVLGIVLILVPFQANTAALIGLVIVGIGCAPVYPSIIHATPGNFGEENSQAIVGIQMASAYTGSTFMPPLFGLLAGAVGVRFFPVYLAVFAVLLLVMTERVNKITRPLARENAR